MSYQRRSRDGKLRLFKLEGLVLRQCLVSGHMVAIYMCLSNKKAHVGLIVLQLTMVPFWDLQLAMYTTRAFCSTLI